MAKLRWAAPRAAAAVAIGVTAMAAPALASASGLPSTGKLTTCKTKVFTAFGVPVNTQYGKEKGKHPAQSLLSCTNANAVARAGKADVLKADGKTGAKLTHAGVRYTLQKYELGGAAPVYTWVGGGVVIYLLGT